MTITNCTTQDIKEIFNLYKIASDFQRAKKVVTVWPDFDRDLVEREIRENRQWKITIDGKVACVWAITFSDDQIWENSHNDAAIYIHRVATNPNFRGNNFVTKIVDWAKQYAQEQGKDFVRLDTTGNNTGLIEHYKRSGFDFLGIVNLSNTEGLPGHYTNAPVCLFEIKL